MAAPPILISIPHSSPEFPGELREGYKPKFIGLPEDTDWFVDKLYDFAPSLGIEVIKAPYSRYVIDLNRDPSAQALYDDGRVETSLIPLKSFKGEELFINERPDEEEVKRRLELYYWPYYKEVEKRLDALKRKSGQVLFFDAHSIKRSVETISKKPFPDLILGNQDGKTASFSLIQTAIDTLSNGPFELAHNSPFKGGHLTRFFGRPDYGVHALQLEMSQDIYMDEESVIYNEEKAEIVKELLKSLFENFIKEMES